MLDTLVRSLVLVLAGAVGAAAEIVTLDDGTLVHGVIVEFDEAVGFKLKRVDNGGVLSLRWEHLAQGEAERIKVARGFTGEDPEPYLLPVVHLVMRNGTTETGVLLEDGDGGDTFQLRQRSGVETFPKSFVKLVEQGRVEGLRIYGPDELYQRLRLEHGEPEDAHAHFRLAVACHGAGLYEQAKEHYEAVRAADAAFKSDLVDVRLAAVAIKIEDTAETAVLDEIRNRLYRKQFEVALTMVDEFARTYPNSRQLSELQQLTADIHRRKREHYGLRIVTDYLRYLEDRLARIARDGSLSLEVARELAESAVHEDIVETLSSSYALTVDTIDELWEQRRGGSVRSYSYGTGTFILGKEKALEFGRFERESDEEGEDPLDEPVGSGFEDVVEQVRREQEARQAERESQRRRGTRLDDVGPSPEEWWASAPTEDRVRWIMAYCAEFSGRMHVIEARGKPCRMCDARGYLEVTNLDGDVERRTCETCKDLKYERLVRYR